jgi:hypothetical protein
MRRYGLIFLLAMSVTLSWAEETEHYVTDFVAPEDFKMFLYNKAPMEVELADEYPPIEPPAGHDKKSLKVKATWPGGEEFHYVSLQIQANKDVLFEANRINIWVKGTGTRHIMEVAFKDASGEAGKVAMGELKSTEWIQLTKVLPIEVKQPIQILGINLHDWNDKTVGETICYLSLFGVTVDSAKPLEPK